MENTVILRFIRSKFKQKVLSAYLLVLTNEYSETSKNILPM